MPTLQAIYSAATSCSLHGGPRLSRPAAVGSWIAQVVAAGILAQTLFFKFTAAPESIEIFSKLGVEPVGRLGAGFAELVTVVFLLFPRTAGLGGLAAAGMMVGAIGAHLAVLGIEIQDDGGLLFGLAVTVLLCGAVVAILRRHQLAALVATPAKQSAAPSA